MEPEQEHGYGHESSWCTEQLLRAILHTVRANGKKLNALIAGSNYSLALQVQIDKIDEEAAALVAAVAAAQKP